MLAVKVPDGTIRTVLTPVRYVSIRDVNTNIQVDNVLNCQSCDNRFKIDQYQITSGDCSPSPIFG